MNKNYCINIQSLIDVKEQKQSGVIDNTKALIHSSIFD